MAEQTNLSAILQDCVNFMDSPDESEAEGEALQRFEAGLRRQSPKRLAAIIGAMNASSYVVENVSHD